MLNKHFHILKILIKLSLENQKLAFLLQKLLIK